MKVDAPILPQDAPHLHEAHSQPAQERRHVHPVGNLCRLDHGMDGRAVVLDLICPFRTHIIVPPPAVGEPCPGRKAIRRRVEVLVLVERRIGCDEVDCVAVHPPQEFQVVPVVQRPIPKVDFRHFLSPYLRGGWDLLLIPHSRGSSETRHGGEPASYGRMNARVIDVPSSFPSHSHCSNAFPMSSIAKLCDITSVKGNCPRVRTKKSSAMGSERGW